MFARHQAVQHGISHRRIGIGQRAELYLAVGKLRQQGRRLQDIVFHFGIHRIGGIGFHAVGIAFTAILVAGGKPERGAMRKAEERLYRKLLNIIIAVVECRGAQLVGAGFGNDTYLYGPADVQAAARRPFVERTAFQPVGEQRFAAVARIAQVESPYRTVAVK